MCLEHTYTQFLSNPASGCLSLSLTTLSLEGKEKVVKGRIRDHPLGATRSGMCTASGLGLTDTVVFGILTVAGYVVGFYFSFTRSCRIEKSAVDGSGVEQEAFLGGRTLPSYALAVSVVASTANAVSIVGFVGHYFAHGFHFMWPGAAIPLAAAVAATVMVPLLYRLRVASVFQYLRMRFDNKVGTTACIVFFILSQILGAVGVYSSAIAVSTMFPIPMMYSSIAIGLAGTIYTALVMSFSLASEENIYEEYATDVAECNISFYR
ncbi:hypothetical protein MRX96_001744 [Rhipicephalus microplus]